MWKAVLSPARNSDKVSKNLGNGTVVYEGHHSKDTATLSVWHINLYGGVMLGDGSDSSDATEVMTDWWVVTGPKNLLLGLAPKRLVTAVND